MNRARSNYYLRILQAVYIMSKQPLLPFFSFTPFFSRYAHIYMVLSPIGSEERVLKTTNILQVLNKSKRNAFFLNKEKETFNESN